METPAVQLLIQSGTVPENVLQQLVRWKLLSEEALAQDGSLPDSSSTGWKTAAEFVSTLNSLIDLEQSTIRETDFEVTGIVKVVYLKWGNGRFDKRGKVAILDSLGRVLIPEDMLGNGAKVVLGISFTPDISAVRKVVSEEARFDGVTKTVTVFSIEPEGQK